MRKSSRHTPGVAPNKQYIEMQPTDKKTREITKLMNNVLTKVLLVL